MSLARWIRRRQSPAQQWAYKTAVRVLGTDVPPIPVLHHVLAGARRLRRGPLRLLAGKLYYAPLLRMRAATVGRSLILYEDMPKVLGQLRIELGNRITLSGGQVWIGCGDTTEKLLRIDDDSYIGFGAEIFSGTEVIIGKHVLIANHVLINGYDGHPLDPLLRAAGKPPGPEGYGAIRIEDYAWIGSKAIILKNVTVGRGAVVATGAVITKDVPELSVVAGNPARVIRRIERPSCWEGDDL